jgi:hypothetical protein
MAIENEALGWDDPIEAQDSQFTLLTPGEYTYRVDDFERGRFDGSDKMQACPMATLTLSCANATGEVASVQTRLFLNKKQQWKLTQFFKSCHLIPQDASGQTHLPWDKVLGAMGQCKVKNRTYNGNQYNEIDSFITDKAGKTSAASGMAQAPSAGGYRM